LAVSNGGAGRRFSFLPFCARIKIQSVKIKKLSIRGFCSLKDVTWEPGDLNVLIGPNASGKSNLLRGIELLQQAVAGDLDNAIVRQGGIGPILWANQPLGHLEWGLDLDIRPVSKVLPFPPLSRPLDSFSYELLLTSLGFGGGYRIVREILWANRGSGKGQRFKCLERDPKEAMLFDSDGKRLEASSDRLDATQTILSQASKMFSMPEISFFHRHLKGWRIYQDLNVNEESQVRRAVITRREMLLAQDGQNLPSVLHTLYTTNKELKTEVNNAMQAAFGREFEGLEFTPAEDQRVQMRLQWKSFKTAHSAANLSDGTLRFLMLLAVLVNRSRGDLVAIDEPETGLHPSMFPIIAELAAEASRSSQIIFSTHSPEFLTALGQHGPTTTVVQAVDGETKLSVLDGDDLKRWLEKYTLGELFVSGGAEALT
jgi:predicted ATPase